MTLIHAARTAQYLAVRALTLHGLAHPVTHVLLAAAATAAAQAWEAGHRVEALHPTHRRCAGR
ncbi:hypothetical protein ACFYUH_36985 [Streptomyces fimicarius]|uniref:hypothetical protein n=1 Tax=Streptomyces griseus TaxID=1911 RepID=UPI0036948CBC